MELKIKQEEKGVRGAMGLVWGTAIHGEYLEMPGGLAGHMAPNQLTQQSQ